MTAAAPRKKRKTAAQAKADIDAYVQKLVDDAPPLSPAQRDNLRVLLRG